MTQLKLNFKTGCLHVARRAKFGFLDSINLVCGLRYHSERDITQLHM